MATHKAPPNLGAAGKALWKSIAGEYELSGVELAVLASACRQADDVALLEKLLRADGLIVSGSQGQPRLNAAITELRQGRLATAKLLAELRLPAEDQPALSPASLRSQRASNQRWDAVRTNAARAARG